MADVHEKVTPATSDYLSKHGNFTKFLYFCVVLICRNVAIMGVGREIMAESGVNEGLTPENLYTPVRL
ncbi:hypothetical protein SPLC1_S411060 [Arthrospira platensis C1]|nr:hypothetical protein SPLC1_S411060 [Arthrospira platensis C1]